ncbi:MAG TPA: hypothetical protein VNV86_13940 [Candidatus Acidoferrum sp.]|nr:hypothetical protein [Candidatus Acidoferrum sp.]
MLPHVIFQVYAGEKRFVMVDLIKAYGVDAVIGGGKDSAEFYLPISHPEKFAGLTELWRPAIWCSSHRSHTTPRRSSPISPPSTIPPCRPLRSDGWRPITPSSARVQRADQLGSGLANDHAGSSRACVGR